MKKLKIAMFLSSDSSKTGGVQEHVYYLAKALEARGHRVKIFGASKTFRFRSYQRIGRLIQTSLPNGNWISVTIPSIRERKLSQIINYPDFDFCHIHEPYTPFISWELIAKVKVPKVVTFHGAWDKNSLGSILDNILPVIKNKFSQKVDGAIYISRVVKERWQNLCLEKMFKKVIYYGIDHAAFYPIEREKGRRLNLLFLARLVQKKGLLYLLKAFIPLIPDFPELYLNVVGDGEDRSDFELFVKENNLSNNVSFKGELMGEKKIPFYQNADIFCAPYWDEGFALTVLEAMACGCPVAGFQNDAFSDWLSGYPQQELLVKKKDVKGLARALRKLITDSSLRKKVSDWCVKRSWDFSWEKTAKETEKFYYRVLEDKKNSRT